MTALQSGVICRKAYLRISMVEIVRDVSGITVVDLARRVGEGVPDTDAPTPLIHRTLHL